MTAHTTAVLDRHRLRKRSSRAAAKALRAAAATLPPGAERWRLARLAGRIDLCASTTASYVTDLPGRGPAVLRRKSRACRSRFCFDCEADRSAAHAERIDALLTEVWSATPGAIVLFLTLTLRSYPLSALAKMRADLDRAVQRLHQHPRILAATLGHYTVFEVAINRQLDGVLTAHIHAHAFVVVAPGALSDNRFVRQAEWVRLWQHAAGIKYKPIVDIRRARAANGDASEAGVRASIPELAKYVLKVGSESLLSHRSDGSVEMTLEVALTLARGLHRRRMHRFNRCFAEAAKALKRRDSATSSDSGP